MMKRIVSIIEWFFARPWVVFFVVTLLVVFPMWQSGYIFLLDMGVSPTAQIDLWQQSIVRMATISLGTLINYGLYQKIIYFVIIYLLGIGGYLFVREVTASKVHKVESQKDEYKEVGRWVCYLGGVFMLFNPFVYGRLVDGQWIVAIGMIGMLFMMMFLLRWARTQRRWDLIWAIVIAGVTVMFSQHALFSVLGISLLFFVFLSIATHQWRVWLWWLVLVGAVLVFNANVIIGYAFSLSETSTLVEQFNEEHLHVFGTVKNGYASLYTNVASLHGYWGEGEDRFISTQEHVFIWKPLFFIFLSIAALGVWFGRHKWQIWFIVVSGFISFILAMGTEGVFAPLSQFLYDHVPFYIGLREPQKWAGVLAISFIGLMSYGLQYLLSQGSLRKHVHLWGLLFLVMILLYTPTMLFGFRGQLVPQDFPQQWYDVRDEIGCEKIDERILALPWHQYMKMDFLDDKKVVNPARGFFGECLIQGDNMEADHVYTQKFSAETEVIEKYFAPKAQHTDASSLVQELNDLSVRYIILSHSEDYQKDLWLNDVEGITKISEDTFLTVYEISVVQE